MRWRTGSLVTAAFVGLAFAVPVWAQQKLAVVNPGLVYLPQSGVALDARSGQVRWRTPRYGPRVLSSGHGLVIVSYLAVVQRDSLQHPYRWTRYCRLNPKNGRAAWCVTALDAIGAALSADSQYLFVQRPRRVEVYSSRDGRHLRGAGTPDGEMMPLADGGVAVFSPHPRQSRLWAFSLAMQRAVVKVFTRPMFPFHGPGAGVLWYAPGAGRFVGGLGATPDLPAAAGASFPDAQTDRWGFAVSQNDGADWRLSGGEYHAPPWSRSLPVRPTVRLSGQMVLAWWPAGQSTAISAFNLRDGALLFHRTLPVQVDDALIAAGKRERAIALFAPGTILCLDPRTGRTWWWRDNLEVDAPAALTAPAVLAWDGGELAAYSRRRGRLLWRVKFRLRAGS
ncbi:MAG: PQQ-binding-like beta-propeller repeat protein [Terriglobales bacterium]